VEIQIISSGLTLGGIYALIALGFTFVFASTRVVAFAQGDYTMFVGMVAATIAGAVTAGMTGFWIAGLASPFIGAFMGFVAYQLFFRWARSIDAMTVSLIFFGVAISLQGAAVVLWGTEPRAIPVLSSIPPFRIGTAIFPITSLMVFITTSVLLVSVLAFLTFTKIGRATTAVAQNREAAALCGINVTRIILVSMVLSGLFAGIAGFLITPIQTMDYLGGVPLTFKGFAAAALGGLTRRSGALVGAYALGLMEAMAAGYVGRGTIAQEVGLMLPLLVLLIVGPRLQAPTTRSEEGAEHFTANVGDETANL
jgi:branched-chain amino acid transport system permease protein